MRCRPGIVCLCVYHLSAIASKKVVVSDDNNRPENPQRAPSVGENGHRSFSASWRAAGAKASQRQTLQAGVRLPLRAVRVRAPGTSFRALCGAPRLLAHVRRSMALSSRTGEFNDRGVRRLPRAGKAVCRARRSDIDGLRQGTAACGSLMGVLR